MKFTKLSGMGPAGEILYKVTEYKAKTVVEFINEVLEERPREWGYFEIPQAKETKWYLPDGSVDTTITSEFVYYRDGDLHSFIPDCLQYREIESIKAVGGYSAMDYEIIVKK